MTALRALKRSDMHATAAVHRLAFDDRLPQLAGRRTPGENRRFFRDTVFLRSAVRGAFDGRLQGFVALRDRWIDHLHVRPAAQGRGIGGALVDIAKRAAPAVRLRTFHCNRDARALYECRGFRLLERPAGRGNEDREPEAPYLREAGP